MKTYRLSAISIALAAIVTCSCGEKAVKPSAIPAEVTMSKEKLMDKIKGGWAGQMIGCTYGGPTEFVYSTLINDNIPIEWPEHRIQWYYDKIPGSAVWRAKSAVHICVSR